jgi:hypothetical protein
MMRPLLRFGRIAMLVFVTAALAGPAVAGSAKSASSRVVVELFTSQGCSSCPPADAFLHELSKRDGVIALSFHVDYWNYLGWADPFSIPEATARQRSYRDTLGLRYVYTPQMVIGGASQAVGSKREDVLRAIAARTAAATPRVDVAMSPSEPGKAVIAIGAGKRPKQPATVWAFLYDREHITEIVRGENEGVKLVNTNVVRAIRRIGEWTGTRERIIVDLATLGAAGRDGCAIVVQDGGYGPILGAGSFPLPRGSS